MARNPQISSFTIAGGLATKPIAQPSPDTKIHRAKRHLADFEAAVGAFYAGKPYAVSTQEEDGVRTYRAKILQNPPAELSMIAGDVIHNARAALDHLVAAFVVKGGGNIERASLPFQQSSFKIKGKIADKSPQASPGARKFIYRLKPYKGGNKLLWMLHSLDGVDKHRAVIPVGAVYAKARFSPKPWMVPDGMSPFLDLSYKTSGFVEDGDIIFKKFILPDTEIYEDLHFTFEIRFSDADGLLSEDAIVTLKRLVAYSEKIIAIARRRGHF